MKIKNLSIDNYRSIRHLDLDCRSMVVLLGPNNHGKSNMLCALEFALSTAAKPTEDDFFAHRDEDTFWVEITFNDLTEQEKKTFQRYVRSDGSVCVRKTCTMNAGKIDSRYNGYVEEPPEAWLEASNAGDYNSREKINETPLAEFAPAQGRITKAIVEEAQRQYIYANREALNFGEWLEDGAFLGQKNIAGGVLPDFFLIPAVKDLTDEIRVRSTTTFGRLIGRAIREMAERDPRFTRVQEQLKELVTTLNDRKPLESGEDHQLRALEKGIEQELQGSWDVKVNIEVTPPEIERLFETGTNLHVDDGIATAAERKGHGLQRAIIFALLRSWARGLRAQPEGDADLAPRKQSDSVIFAMEEPELFLHPHAQRRLSGSLRDIAETSEHQVFLCTHSTHFVDLNHYQDVAIARKADTKTGTQVRQCTQELFAGEDLSDLKNRFRMAQWVNPDRAEMFFCRRVVFVEGESEKVLLPFLANKLGQLDTDVSVIDCGSKHNLSLYARIAKAFEIPYLVVHDEDPLPDPIPDTWNQDKIRAKRDTFAVNAKLEQLVDEPLGSSFMLSPDLEKASSVSKSQGEKMGKPLAALRHFEAVASADIPDCLKDLVTRAFGG